MEIVVVSDTVRQRRSRTPSSTTPTKANESLAKESKPESHVMPDLLPKTFHLAESSALFSQVDGIAPNFLTRTNSSEDEQKVSVVEIREVSISTPKRAINTYKTNDCMQSHNAGQIMNTCSILESVRYLEPSCVETVHIIDATSEPSDTETPCSTPNLDERPESKPSSSDDEESDEYETGEPGPSSIEKMKIVMRQISYDENKKALQKDRDFLKDSEQFNRQKMLEKAQRKKLSPNLKDILSATSDRDSFYSNDKEVFDEPLTFSDDDDSNHFDGLSTDRFNRDTVLINKPPQNKTKK